MASIPKRVLLLGSTGTIGEATRNVLTAEGHQVVSIVRPQTASAGFSEIDQRNSTGNAGNTTRYADVTSARSLSEDGFCGERFDVLVSCLASRTGVPNDAWAIDYKAHMIALEAAQHAGISHFILLSAICVQKPLLEFQKAKLAFEKALIDSGLTYTIVRPTAYFKSLSGQIDRLRKGKAFLLFGDGAITACKPVSDRDLAHFIATCIYDRDKRNKILPIGGPDRVLTPKQQGALLFEALGLKPHYKNVPISILDMFVSVLSLIGRISPQVAQKAELARIGRYYATESMLVYNPHTGEYDADATPSTGVDTLANHYRNLVQSNDTDNRGDHSVF